MPSKRWAPLGVAMVLAIPMLFGLAGCDAPKMASKPQDKPTEASRQFNKDADGQLAGGRADSAANQEDEDVAAAAPPPREPSMSQAPAGGGAPPRPKLGGIGEAAKPPAKSRSYKAQRPPGAAAPSSAQPPPPTSAPSPVTAAPPPSTAAPTPSTSTATPPARDAGVTKPGTAVIDEKSDWDVVPVFFGTDRARATDPKRIAYGSDRGRKLELGRALVTVPKAHAVPNIERPWAIKVPYFDVKLYEQAEDPKKHFTMKEIQSLTRDQFLAFVKERLATSARYKDHAVIFVHGYNTAFDAAIYRTAQMAYDLHFDGAPFLYSWPSGGTFESYTYDRESAGQSQPFMRDFLELVVKETGAKSVSIIAHSMGNQPVLQILRDLQYSKPKGVVISQIILAAPDVDRDNFENIAKEIKGMASGVTLYAASNDRALTISRRFNGGIPRAGDVPTAGPMILPGIDTIDVTAAGMEGLYLNHSSYAENNALLADIGLIIQTGERPPDKRFPILQKMTTDHGDYWKYPPKR